MLSGVKFISSGGINFHVMLSEHHVTSGNRTRLYKAGFCYGHGISRCGTHQHADTVQGIREQSRGSAENACKISGNYQEHEHANPNAAKTAQPALMADFFQGAAAGLAHAFARR